MNNFYERKMHECLLLWQQAVEEEDTQAQEHWMREYNNYQKMNKPQ